MNLWRSKLGRATFKVFENLQICSQHHPTVAFQRRLNDRWRRARPWLHPSISSINVPEVDGSTATLTVMGIEDKAVVVRMDSSSPARTWADQEEEIKLLVMERQAHWEVGIVPFDKSEIFYNAEITKSMVAAITDLGTVAVWDRDTRQLIHCRLVLLLQNEHRLLHYQT